MRYFKTSTPEISIHVSGGSPINWQVADHGSGFGFHATEEEVEIKALESCIKRNIGGGISEIEAAEWDGFLKKNTNPAPLRGRLVEREGFIPGGPAIPTTSQALQPKVSHAPAAGSPPPEPPPEPPAQEPAKPKLGKRKT